MSREIKFRAWHPSTETMLNDVGFGADATGITVHSSDLDNFGFSDEDIETLDSIDEYYFVDGIKLMQYTGLKDKNGVEIYEGDILRNGARVSLVRYSDEMAGFMDSDSNMLWESLFAQRLEHTRVIGNIYENPELLGSRDGDE